MLLPIALLLAQIALPVNQLQIVQEKTFQSLPTNGMSNPNAILSVQIKAILPDGSHVLLTCQDFHDNWCATVEMLKPKTRLPRDRHCSDSSASRDIYSISHSCTYNNLGAFTFEKKGDSITILGRNGKSVLRIQGHWLPSDANS